MKKVSIYKSVKDNTGKTIDLFEALEAIKTGGFGLKEHQSKVRSEKVEKRRKQLKESTPSITPSGEFSERSDSKLIAHSGFLNFDIDYIEQLEAILAKVKQDEFTFAVWRSISGKGISGLFRVSDDLDRESHKEKYEDMIAYFQKFHGIEIDNSCKNVSRLRFLSYDPDFYTNEGATVFNWERPKLQKSQLKASKRAKISSSDYITQFNKDQDCESLLSSYGWTKLYTSGGNIRMTRPRGTKGENHGTVYADNRFKSFTPYEVLSDKDKPVSAFDIFCHYEHGGNEEAAKDAIRPFKKSRVFDEIPLPSLDQIPFELETSPIVTPDFKAKQATTIKIKTAEKEEVTLPTFPIDSLPKHFQNIVAAVCNALDTPADLLACSLMMAASVAVGHSMRLRLANGWTQSCSLFMALIGDSAAGKSPAMDFAFKYLRGKDAALIHQYNKEKEEFDLAQMEKETRNSVPKPIKQELILEDSTIESTMKTLSENKFGVGLVVDEIAGWINSMNQYKAGKGSEEKKWLTIFDNRDLKKSTIGRGTEVITAPFVSVVGGIQPQVLHQIAKDGRNYDGFMFRFMFCIAEQKKPKKWDDLVQCEIPDEVEEAWNGAIENLLGVRETARRFQAENETPFQEVNKWLEIKLVHQSEAGKLWGNWYDANIREIENARKADELEKVSALTKLSIIASRLILLNEMLLVAQGGYTPDEVSTEAVKSALKQTAYFKSTAFYAFSIINEQAEGNQKRETKCDWRKIFTSQEDVEEGLRTTEIIERILNTYGKAKRTALSWIKADLTEAPKLKSDSGRTKRYTI